MRPSSAARCACVDAGNRGDIGGNQVVFDLVLEHPEPELGDLREQHTLARQTVGHDDVEGADPVGGDDQQCILTVFEAQFIQIAHLAAALVGEIEIRFQNGFVHFFFFPQVQLGAI